jgi:alpha-beta hydrolase superfamily lysophospholipase
VEFAGARHDILNEAEHRDVAKTIIGFIEAHAR